MYGMMRLLWLLVMMKVLGVCQGARCGGNGKRGLLGLWGWLAVEIDIGLGAIKGGVWVDGRMIIILWGLMVMLISCILRDCRGLKLQRLVSAGLVSDGQSAGEMGEGVHHWSWRGSKGWEQWLMVGLARCIVELVVIGEMGGGIGVSAGPSRVRGTNFTSLERAWRV